MAPVTVIIEQELRQMLAAVCDTNNRCFAEINWERRTIEVRSRPHEIPQWPGYTGSPVIVEDVVFKYSR